MQAPRYRLYHYATFAQNRTTSFSPHGALNKVVGVIIIRAQFFYYTVKFGTFKANFKNVTIVVNNKVNRSVANSEAISLRTTNYCLGVRLR